MLQEAVKPTAETKLDEFLSELTELCQKHGIGLGGHPEPYVMEPEDSWFQYICDQDGQIVLG
jgi:hypothetical protein